MKHNVTKILSIMCLVAVLACAWVPFVTVSGQYMEIINGLTGSFATMPEEQITEMEQMFAQFGIEIKFATVLETVDKVVEPFSDGAIAITDFIEVSTAIKEAANELGGISTEGIPEEYYPALQESGMLSMIEALASAGEILQIASLAVLIPVGIYGLLAVGVIIRIIFRILGRRGLGVLITLAAILNAAFMLAIPYGANFMIQGQLPITFAPTYVPFVLVGGTLASCIIWAIGRDAKVKVVKENVYVEVPVAAPVDAEVVEETIAEEVVVEETVVEESVVAEEEVEETVTEEEEKVEE